MTLKRIKARHSAQKTKGGYLLMYFPNVGIVSIRAQLVVYGKEGDSGPLLDRKGRPEKTAKILKTSDLIREGRIEYRHMERLYGCYAPADAGFIQERFEGLFAFVPFLDQHVETRVLAACEAHLASTKP